MDFDRFDALSRSLSTARSRRRALAAAVGGLLAALGGRKVARAVDKVPICHRTGSDTNSFILIEVPADNIEFHRAHGDVDPSGGACPETCLGARCTTDTDCCAEHCCQIPVGETFGVCDTDCFD